MCGFVGIFDSRLEGRVDAALGLRMRNQLAHRGPDGAGEWHDSNLFLGHTRLSILDLSENGLQPIFNASQTLACVFNGEIYNFKETRKALELKGFKFKSESDGEVIPYLYEVYGEDFLEHIEG